MNVELHAVRGIGMMKRLPFLLLATVVLGSGCDFERNGSVAAYRQQLAWPLAQIQTYSASYARNNALCNPKDRRGIGAWHCNEAKADLATIRVAEEQALPIYEQMANDPVLNDQDRQVARQSVARLRADLG